MRKLFIRFANGAFTRFGVNLLVAEFALGCGLSTYLLARRFPFLWKNASFFLLVSFLTSLQFRKTCEYRPTVEYLRCGVLVD